MIEVKVLNKSKNSLPEYATTNSAGCDLMADFSDVTSKIMAFNSFTTWNEDKTVLESVTIRPGGRALIPTNLFIALPEGYEAQVRPRSGLAIKKGITCLNAPGTIDADYRGNVGVVLANLGNENFEVKQGDRIAQMVICKVEQISWKTVLELDSTDRGEQGFGHSGVSSTPAPEAEPVKDNITPNLTAEEILSEKPKSKNTVKSKK